MPFPRLQPREHAARIASLRLVQSHEIALERHLARVFVAIGRNAMSRYVAGGEPTDAVAPAMISNVLAPSIRETARMFGQMIGAKSAWLGIERKLFESLDADTEEFLRQYTAERVVQISDALKRQITNIIRDGLANGTSTEEVAQAIVDATSGTMALARARRIARTETHTASMVGQFGAARASPLQYRKTWLATEDARTRPDHAEANGQTQPLDEPFTVGDEELMFPGDPNGSPGQVINCRCVMTLEPVALLDLPESPEVPPEPPPTPDEVPPEEISAGDLEDDTDAWRAFYDQLRTRYTLPADVTLYAVGAEVGLPQFGTAEDLQDLVGTELVVPRYASLNPIRVGTEFVGLADTFPLFGRPVVAEISAPAGTPIEGGREIAMGVQLASSVRIVVTGVRQERWGETQDAAGVERDPAPARYRHRRLPAGRGVTVVEAEVQS
jgi:hypothetical protein